MTPIRILALVLGIVVLAGAFFALTPASNDPDKDFPPHSVQQ